LIDGSPRELEVAKAFEKQFGEINFLLYFKADSDTLVKRLLERGKSSGRSDDNEETIRHRIEVHK
jgi:adenylate kinase family enzyme